MIITVDPSQSEDIAAFAMVKQYRMQALNVTLNGGTGSGAWQAVQGGEGYTQTVVTPVTGIELVYEDPNAIVSYTVENDDTSNYDAASDAGIILSSIVPTNNAWTYTCVFHADSVPVSSVDIDLLVYGNIARGTEQQGSPATAEEITAQVLAGLETRVSALENEMPDKADKATTYTKTEIDTVMATKANDNAVVKLTGNQTIQGVKTFYSIEKAHLEIKSGRTSAGWDLGALDFKDYQDNIVANIKATTVGDIVLDPGSGGTHAVRIENQRDYNATNTKDVATIKTLDQYAPMVRTANAQTIGGVKTFTEVIRGRIYSNKSVHIYDGSVNWYKIFSISTTERQQHILEVDYIDNVRNVTGEGRMLISHAGGENVCKFLYYDANPTSYIVPGNIALCVGASTIDIWAKRSNIHHIHFALVKSLIGSNNIFMPENKITAVYDSSAGVAEIPTSDYTAITYGSGDGYVHTTGDEVIAGIKTFTSSTIISSAGFTNLIVKSERTTSNIGGLIFRNGNNTDVASIYSSVDGQIIVNLIGSTKTLSVLNQRPYNASNTNDVVTIGTLDAYTPMVRTTGNQIINGTKAFQSGLVGASVQLKTVDMDITTPGTSTRYSNAIMWVDENNVAICKLWISQSATGQIKLGCDIKNSDNTWKFGQILAQGD